MRGFIEITFFVGVFTLLLGAVLNTFYKGNSVNIISGQNKVTANVQESVSTNSSSEIQIKILPLSTTTLDKISADSILVTYKTSDNEDILLEKNKDKPQYLASISKLMTAILSDELLPKTASTSVTSKITTIKGSSNKFPPKTLIDSENLIKSLLIESNNDSAWMLTTLTGSSTQFVNGMNERAKQIGMTSTTFGNPAGLDPSTGIASNTGSASDVSKLIWYFHREKPSLATFSVLPQSDIRSTSGNILYNASSTNDLLRSNKSELRIEAQKTGETPLAGKNLTLVLHSDKVTGYFVVTILKSKDHFEDARVIMNAIVDSLNML